MIKNTPRLIFRNTKLSVKPLASPSLSGCSAPNSPCNLPLTPSLLDQLQLLAQIDPLAFEAVRLYTESELARLGHEVCIRSQPDTSAPRWGWRSHTILLAATIIASAI